MTSRTPTSRSNRPGGERETLAWMVGRLSGGLFVVGFIGALVPETCVALLVGHNSLKSNLVASVVGALWYVVTLTEIPIWEALGKMDHSLNLRG